MIVGERRVYPSTEIVARKHVLWSKRASRNEKADRHDEPSLIAEPSLLKLLLIVKPLTTCNARSGGSALKSGLSQSPCPDWLDVAGTAKMHEQH
jgi:hypothetical protein